MLRETLLRVLRSKNKKGVAAEDPRPFKKRSNRWDLRGEVERTQKQLRVQISEVIALHKGQI